MIDKEYEKELNEKWDFYVSNKAISYDKKLLKTRTIDPKDGRQSFHLVYNEGRRKYIELLAKPRKVKLCPFCTEYYEILRMGDLPSMRILPNQFPCLPYQYILTPQKHTALLQEEYMQDAITFTKKTGFKTYCNTAGSGGAYNHLVFQASKTHPSAPVQDFFTLCETKVLLKENDIRVDRLQHIVFGVKITGENIAKPISLIVNEYTRPLNLLLKGDSVYLFPRIDVEIPNGFGQWKFGVLEAIGNFICQDQETFNTLTYNQLEEAMREISQENEEEQRVFIELVCDTIRGEQYEPGIKFGQTRNNQ